MSHEKPATLQGDQLPQHVAVIMDGNGRWAGRRHLPRFAGHKAGADTVEMVVETCGELGIEVLTLFAFSSENWRRPDDEVSMLMGLFVTTLEQKSRRLQRNNVRLRIIGDRTPLSDTLKSRIAEAESLTRHNTGLNLVVAANYGGRWDITQACQSVARDVANGELDAGAVDMDEVGSRLALAGYPEPDLFIRTGGERRISNFLLWHLAYTELYFTDVLWPDFSRAHLLEAFSDFARRQRRYGKTGEQVAKVQGA